MAAIHRIPEADPASSGQGNSVRTGITISPASSVTGKKSQSVKDGAKKNRLYTSSSTKMGISPSESGPGLHTVSVHEQASPAWKKCDGIRNSTPRTLQPGVPVGCGVGVSVCLGVGDDTVGVGVGVVYVGVHVGVFVGIVAVSVGVGDGV